MDRDLLLGELEVQRFGERVSARRPGARSVGLCRRRRAVHAPRPRVRAARGPARLDRRPRRRPARRPRRGPGRSSAADRPVDRLHTEKAIEQWPGIAIIDDAIERERRPPPADPAVAAVLPRLSAAAATARRRSSMPSSATSEVVLPASRGEGRLGPGLFAAKLRHTMRDRSITTERIRAEAEREFAAVRAEMVRIAARDRPAWLGDGPIPATTAPSSAASSTRSPPSIPRRTACSTSVAGSSPGSRRSAASAA